MPATTAGIIVLADLLNAVARLTMSGSPLLPILLVVLIAAIGVFIYRKKKSAAWDTKTRNTFDILVAMTFLTVICAAAGFTMLRNGATSTTPNSELASSTRDLWQRVKPMPVGNEFTTISLDQLRVLLKHDEDATHAALGDEEFAALKEKLEVDDLHKSKVADLENQMANAKAELDGLANELKESTKRLEKLDEVLPAMKAFQEGRRLAPQGNYQIELKVKKSLTESEELNAAILRTRLECLRTDKHTEDVGASIYVFGNVSKAYAEDIQKRFHGFDATVTVSPPSP